MSRSLPPSAIFHWPMTAVDEYWPPGIYAIIIIHMRCYIVRFCGGRKWHTHKKIAAPNKELLLFRLVIRLFARWYLARLAIIVGAFCHRRKYRNYYVLEFAKTLQRSHSQWLWFCVFSDFCCCSSAFTTSHKIQSDRIGWIWCAAEIRLDCHKKNYIPLITSIPKQL